MRSVWSGRSRTARPRTCSRGRSGPAAAAYGPRTRGSAARACDTLHAEACALLRAPDCRSRRAPVAGPAAAPRWQPPSALPGGPGEAAPAPATIPRRAGGLRVLALPFQGRKERREEQWQPEYESRSRSPAPSASGGTTRPTSRSGTRPTASSSGSIAAGAAGTRFTGRRARHGPVPSVPDPAQARGLPAAGRRRACAPAPPGRQARRSAEEPDRRQARAARRRPGVHGGVLGRAQEGRVAGPPAAALCDHRRHHRRGCRRRLPLRGRLRPPALRARRPAQSLTTADMFRWYVINTYSGHENKVKANLEHRIVSMGQMPRFRRVVVPTEQVVETRDGQKVQIEKRVLPGYVLVNMDLDDDAWSLVKNTPGVTGFVGSGAKPVALAQGEVDRILRTGTPTAERVRAQVEFSLGESVKVTSGPLSDFDGEIVDVNPDQQKLKVLVDIFERQVPVELSFDQVKKID